MKILPGENVDSGAKILLALRMKCFVFVLYCVLFHNNNMHQNCAQALLFV